MLRYKPGIFITSSKAQRTFPEMRQNIRMGAGTGVRGKAVIATGSHCCILDLTEVSLLAQYVQDGPVNTLQWRGEGPHIVKHS